MIKKKNKAGAVLGNDHLFIKHIFSNSQSYSFSPRLNQWWQQFPEVQMHKKPELIVYKLEFDIWNTVYNISLTIQ